MRKYKNIPFGIFFLGVEALDFGAQTIFMNIFLEKGLTGLI